MARHNRGETDGVGHAWNGERPDLFAAMIRAAVAGAQLPDELLPA